MTVGMFLFFLVAFTFILMTLIGAWVLFFKNDVSPNSFFGWCRLCAGVTIIAMVFAVVGYVILNYIVPLAETVLNYKIAYGNFNN